MTDVAQEPTVSWWLCPREQFSERQREEQGRLAASTFGRASDPTTGGTVMRRTTRKGIREWKD